MDRSYSRSEAYRAAIHDLIPGGAHTYSKGDDQFPAIAPAAISHGKGAHVWDLDGNKFLDCPMGLTSVSLGHAYDPVLDRVKEELDRGVNFQRPSYIEREMAELFLSKLPHHDMIKFSKNGSTATSAAVKLARAYTGKEIVLFPEQASFFSYDDWFIGATQCDRGVPEQTKALSKQFKYGDLADLERVLKENEGNVACVITEPEVPFMELSKSYLEQAISLTQKYGALFILDEMISGYKYGFPGVISEMDLKPDISTWGKGIANGFSFCCLTGTKEVMELGGIRKSGEEKVFLVSTTHGGETHGIAAAIATWKIFDEQNVIAHNHKIGRSLTEGASNLIAQHGLGDFIQVGGWDWWPIFSIKNSQGQTDLGYKTLIVQEMIKSGVLFNGFFVPCFSHTQNDVQFFLEGFDKALTVYSKALESNWADFVQGPAIKPVFRKYL